MLSLAPQEKRVPGQLHIVVKVKKKLKDGAFEFPLCVHRYCMKKKIEVLPGANGISCSVTSINQRFKALKERLTFSGGATSCLLVRALSGPCETQNSHNEHLVDNLICVLFTLYGV